MAGAKADPGTELRGGGKAPAVAPASATICSAANTRIPGIWADPVIGSLSYCRASEVAGMTLPVVQSVADHSGVGLEVYDAVRSLCRSMHRSTPPGDFCTRASARAARVAGAPFPPARGAGKGGRPPPPPGGSGVGRFF